MYYYISYECGLADLGWFQQISARCANTSSGQLGHCSLLDWIGHLNWGVPASGIIPFLPEASIEHKLFLLNKNGEIARGNMSGLGSELTHRPFCFMRLLNQTKSQG